MDPAPDAGQLRNEAVDTLGRHCFPSDLQHLQNLQHALDAEPSTLQSCDSSFSDPSSGLQSNHEPLAVGAAEPSALNTIPTTHHTPSSDTARHASPPPVDLDYFYKNYQGPDASAGPDILPMAAASSSRPSRPSVRSNGDGTTSRHPAFSAQHNVPRANLRSVSSPVEIRSSAGSASRLPTGKPSVKDLKKRFDQNAVVGVPTIPPPPGRAIAGLKPTKLRIRSPVTSTSPSLSRRATPTERDFGDSRHVVDIGSSSSSLRQSKFVADHQESASTQSFASRVGKPQNSTWRGLALPRPITSTPKKSTTLPRPVTSASRHPPARGLVFGHVLSDQDGHHGDYLGRSVHEILPRRTSEPCVQTALSPQRNFYRYDVERSSPSPFSHRSPPSYPERAVTASSPRSRPHSRAHSDDGSASPSSRAARHHSWKSSSPHSSKLPIFVRKPSTPTQSPSPSSTRSNSPSTLKRHRPNERPSRESPIASRAKTPTPARTSVTTNNKHARLQAYIAAAPPKLSPTLRSSRPRQPVSIASTSSSRMKETDKVRTARMGEPSNRRPKLSIGPIDFERRREHIKLAYTRSIQENEVVEARHRADALKARRALKSLPPPPATLPQDPPQKQEPPPSQNPLPQDPHPRDPAPQEALPEDTPEPSDVSNNVSHEPESGTSPAQPLTRSDENEGTQELVLESDDAPIQEVTQESAAQSPSGADPSPPLTVATNSSHVTAASQDSPTLGLPGSFPDPTVPALGSGRPLSTASATSNITEFDTEPQITAPVRAPSPIDIHVTDISPAATPSPKKSRSEHQLPSQDESETSTEAFLPINVGQDLQREIELDQATAISGSEVDIIESVEPTGLGIESYDSQYMGQPLCSVSESPVLMDADDNSGMLFPRLGSQFDSECPSVFDKNPFTANQRQCRPADDDVAPDMCTDGIRDHEEELHEVQSREYYEDARHSFGSPATSDAGTFDDAHESGLGLRRQADQQYVVSSTDKLLVPDSGYHDGQISRQSTWTDFSVDSGDQSVMPDSPKTPAYGHVTIFSPQSEPSVNGVQAGQRQDICESEPSRAGSTQYESLHLPEVDTGDGFSIPYFSPDPDDSALLPPRNREPSPVAPSVLDSETDSIASSIYYEPSQYESTLLNSERDSGDYMSRADTSHQSLDSATLATTEQHVNAQTPADGDVRSLAQGGEEELTEKERHRLVQRRNVIKELVDTEAVFVRDMNIVEEIYKGTAEACPKLDSKTVKLIFRNSDEIIAFHTAFLSQIKNSVADVYVPGAARVGQRDDSGVSTPGSSGGTTAGPNDSKDRRTSLGPVFRKNMAQMKLVHEGFLRASDQAAKRLIQIQQDPTVQVWLTECNEVAKDLTAAWDLDSLLIKPMQRITKYPNLILTLLQHTPKDHPDRAALVEAKMILETAIIDINKAKKNFELVGQIVGRKRKESDVKAGFARAFGKRVDKLQASSNRPAEDADYTRLSEKFGDDYLRLQVVLRDVEFYTRQVSAYVHEFLQYMSSIELVMRLQPSNYPELENKWVQFNISVRDLEKGALEEHLAQVRKLVIEPLEHVIKAYGNPSLAMKKREKRRLDYERFEQLRKGGKSPDLKLKELVEQYDALNDTLKKELPQLSALTERIGQICLGNLINIQAKWYTIWQDKMKIVLANCCPDVPDLEEVVTSFERGMIYAKSQLANIGILSPATWGRASISTSMSVDDASLRMRLRPSESDIRSRGQSVNGETPPVLPAPDFGSRHSAASLTMTPHGEDLLSMSPTQSAVNGFANGVVPSPHQYYYRDYYAGMAPSQGGPVSPRSPESIMTVPRSPECPSSFRSGAGAGLASPRPSTSRSHESGKPRQSSESAIRSSLGHSIRTNRINSIDMQPTQQDDNHVFSNMFHSALPMSDGPEEGASQQEPRASREHSQVVGTYNVMWLAASLFEFNIETAKDEAGYPYLTYQTGELFDVLAEKGELWLARNQDDTNSRVGWIWSKHFIRLGDS
ncbi:uncharacterized protein CPUR_06215 [Claviceps purpurea 20.1]|uniref:DH domain-containing protein n=1 Tax=Claviceps purpurea (strain 20.1) TaxID=1111077 RepID=M1W999_CLAP2|nr:uncharacterized protein CPUR_06215 [Claviceps purpurea 20.1]